MTAIQTLKKWFSNFKKPTQEQFWAWIDSFWHKSEKIPMDSIEGLGDMIQGTASAEQLRNHLSDTNAHRALFDKKVDKEDGKGLSSNDYTDEEKRTNQANAQKRVVGLTVTGDVDKIITITFADSTVLQAPFTDKDTLPENLANIKLNSLNFNEQTGVLTGVRSDGQQLTVSLDGRYALLGHSHDDRYSQLGHTHTEYAPLSHRHNWNDIDGKPAFNFLPLTGGNINGDITANSIIKKNSSNDKVLLGGGGDINLSELKNENIKVGCRNLALNTKRIGELNISHTSISNTPATISEKLSGFMEKLQKDELCMLSFDAKTVLPNAKSLLHIESYGDNSTTPGNGIAEIKGNTYKRYSVYVKLLDISNKNLFVWLTQKESDVLVKDFKLYKGTQTEDWSPAPEDFIKTIYVDSPDFYVTEGVIGRTVHINRDCTIHYNDMPLLSTIIFRKVYDGGQITFNGGGTLKYTTDTVFNGKNGSTAVLDMSADISRIYVDIRNI